MEKCLAVNCQIRNCNAQSLDCWEYCEWWNIEKRKLDEENKETTNES